MAVNRKLLGALLCALAVTVLVVGGASASRASTPGVTSTQITIGGTFPMTGPAQLYSTIPLAEKAYYDYINATKGGVFHRKIKDIIKDDQYNPAETVPAVNELVQKDHVFAIVGSLGSATALATWGYTNEHKIPQVLLATGDSFWGTCTYATPSYCAGGKKPWTSGWQPDYPGEAKIYAKYILAHKPAAKIGILYQGDAFGTNMLNAFTKALGAHKNQIVDKESYQVGDSAQLITGHMVALKAAGADTLLIFATPPTSIQALAIRTGLGWSPLTFLGNVGGNPYLMFAAEQNNADINGVYSTGYIANQATQPNLPGVKLAAKLVQQYAPSLQTNFNEDDENIMYGFGVAWSFVYALQHAGKNPTRASFMKALHNMNTAKNPFVYPGMKIQTSAKTKDGFPMEQLVFLKWAGETDAQHPGNWTTEGGIVKSGR